MDKAEASAQKQVTFSGIQPSGLITLGNYLGAVKNWVELQEQYDCIYCIVDLHAITVRQDPAALRKNTLEAYAVLLACGIDPQRSTAFIQSHAQTHAELAWVLNCYTQFGELSRMTQFKDKSARYADNINAGLFTYPTLMAADILLYQTHFVPVGEDQRQHVELARDVCDRFNGLYGQVFTKPECLFPKLGAKIMSLADPMKKMSKSDENPAAYVALLDSPDTILRKFKRAVTDSEAQVSFREGKDGINNLMTIYASVTQKSFADIENEFAGRGYGDFKIAVGEAVIEAFRPVRERYERLIADRAYLEACYRLGAEKALARSRRTLDKVYRKVGFLGC
jgi:tryptophanyl-tRNA synthetase